MRQLKFIDLFAGVGGFRSGFTQAGMECIGWCEWDKFAQKSYRAMYETEGEWFANDIRTVNGEEMPKADVWTFGFPCQDISTAGKQRGLAGNRSGLFFEVMRLLDEAKDNKPEWIVCENVRNLLSIDKGWGMYTVTTEMAKRGYTVEWKLYNSKDYGVPQSRNRVYIAGHLGGGSGRTLLPAPRKSNETIKALVGGSQGHRVLDSIGVACTQCSCGGGLGAKTGLYLVDLTLNKPKITNVARCLVRRYTAGITKFSAVNSGVLSVRACLTPDRLNKRQNGRRFKEDGEPAFTLTTQDRHGVLLSDGRFACIRRLTPREGWRLQGFSDEQFEKAQSVNSNAQLYAQSGNAVTVNVARAIGEHIVNWKESDDCQKGVADK